VHQDSLVASLHVRPFPSCNVQTCKNTVQYSNCGRGSQTSPLASEPRAHEGAQVAQQRTPVSQVRCAGDRDHHQASRQFQYPITPAVGDPCWEYKLELGRPKVRQDSLVAYMRGWQDPSLSCKFIVRNSVSLGVYLTGGR
jgi:hypothetical protein